MQQPWAQRINELVQHTLVYSAGFVLVAIEVVYGAVITSLVGHVITSKFVLRILTALEYTMVIANALSLALLMTKDVLRKLRSLLR